MAEDEASGEHDSRARGAGEGREGRAAGEGREGGSAGEGRGGHERTSEFPEGEREEGRGRLEAMFRDAVRKAVEKGVEAGVGTFSKADKAVRGVASEVPLPREIAGYFFSQIDETKNVLVRVVAGEVREFLDATDVAGELQRALTSLSFEIKTEVRFIPNDSGGIRPSIRSKASPKIKREKRTSSAPPPPPSAAEEE